jgi:hypothetical protein
MNASFALIAIALAGTPTAFSGVPPRNARPPAQAASAPPAPLSDEEVAARVGTYLASIDTPIRAEQWQALGPRAVSPLKDVVSDPSALPSRRAKAVGALALVGGAKAKRLVLAIALSDDEPFGVRASALAGAGQLLSTPALVRALRPVMEQAKEAPVRAVAAEVLSRHAQASACGAIRAQAGREAPDGRAVFERALSQCSPARP